MLFNSYIFILLFFPVVLIGYYLTGRFGKLRMGNIFLIGMSLWFYGYYNPKYLFIICGSIIFNYIFSKLILARRNVKSGKWLTAAGVIVNVAIIFYFKYYDFFIENINAVFKTTFELYNIALPLGISFFTFQQISYIVDSYHGETEGYSFDEYALFVCYFPQLIAGPIVLHNELIPQFRDASKRRFNAENFGHGMYIFALGLFKKVLLADTLSKAVTWGFNNIASLTAAEAWLVSFSYTFQLFFDFSGYCDMAIGIGYMMNINLPQNFNSPYKALSIPDFWSRWHMTLTRFLRTYIYFPLGGSRCGAARTYLNIMIVFLVSGIWHGASWTFIAWGILHGILNCLTRVFNKSYEKLHPVFRWMLTLVLVNFLWVIFRAPTLGAAKQFFIQAFTSQSMSISSALTDCYVLPDIIYALELLPQTAQELASSACMWVFLFISLFVILNFKNSSEIKPKASVARGIVTAVFIYWSVMSLSGISEFLYFDF
jgi:alginate O-acetyltransferase complex protein AlgI